MRGIGIDARRGAARYHLLGWAAPHPARNVTRRPAFACPPSDWLAFGGVTDLGGCTIEGNVDPRLAFGRAPYTSRFKLIPLGDARADSSGRFRIDAPRTSSSQHESFGAVALAPGYGVGWVEMDPDDDQPTTEVSLRPEQVIHGR